MPNLKISQFTNLATSAQSPTYLLPLADSGVSNFKMSLDAMFSNIGANTTSGQVISTTVSSGAAVTNPGILVTRGDNKRSVQAWISNASAPGPQLLLQSEIVTAQGDNLCQVVFNKSDEGGAQAPATASLGQINFQNDGNTSALLSVLAVGSALIGNNVTFYSTRKGTLSNVGVWGIDDWGTFRVSRNLGPFYSDIQLSDPTKLFMLGDADNLNDSTNTALHIRGTADTMKNLVVQSRASQSVNVFEHRSSANALYLQISQTGILSPGTAGGVTIGSAALPFSSAYIGNAATNNIQLTGTATAARVATFPDASGTVQYTTTANTVIPTSTFAGLPAAPTQTLLYSLTDNNRGLWTYNLQAAQWVSDSAGKIYAADFGVSPSATAANNRANLLLAVAAAAAGYPVIEFGEGTFDFNDEIPHAGGITFQGQGANKTILRYSKATGSFFRAADYAVSQGYNRYLDFQIVATGAAINSATVGIDLSSISNAIVSNVTSYNFGTQILLNGFASGSLVSTYYNTIQDVNLGNSSAGLGYGSGIKIVGGANSNNFYRPRFSYMQRQIDIGDSADDTPNQIFIIDPVCESWEAYAVYVNKGISIDIRSGRYETSGINTVFYVPDSPVSAQYINFDAPFLSLPSTATVLASTNPSVTFRPGSASSAINKQIGQSSAVGWNLIPNSGFEGWPPGSNYPLLGWTNVNGTNWADSTIYISRESSIVKDGTYSVRVGNAVNTAIGLAAAAVEIDPSYPCTLSWWSYGTTTTVGYRLAIRFFDSAGAQIVAGWTNPTLLGVKENGQGGTSTMFYSGSYNAWVIASDLTHATAATWIRQAFAFNAPSGTKTIQLGYVLTATPAQYFYLDDVQLVQGQTLLRGRDLPIVSGGDQNFYGTLTLTKLKTSDPYQGAGSLEISVLGAGSQIKEASNNRIYYDAYNHVWRRENSSTGMMRLSELGNLSFGATVFSEDVGLKRSGAGILEVNRGTGGANLAVTFTAIASGVNYLDVSSAITTNSPTLSAVGSDANISITLTPKGTGSVNTSAPLASGAHVVTSSSSLALAVGANGITNPQLLVDANTASVATGVKITGAAAGGNIAITAISSGSNESLQLSPKGTGIILIGDSGTATATAGAATLNTQRGVVTSESLTTAAQTAYALTITNDKISASSKVFVSVQNGTNSVDNIHVQRVTPGSGSVTITIFNATAATALNGTILVSFIVT